MTNKINKSAKLKKLIKLIKENEKSPSEYKKREKLISSIEGKVGALKSIPYDKVSTGDLEKLNKALYDLYKKSIIKEQISLSKDADAQFNRNQFEEIKRKFIKIEMKELERLKNNVSSMFVGEKGISSFQSYIKSLQNARNFQTLMKLWILEAEAADYGSGLDEEDFWKYFNQGSKKL